ncbi:hypothetical protein ACS0TY_015017 [Phlomoides rotata]
MSNWHKSYAANPNFAPENIDAAIWQAIKDYWARPEVIAKRAQCQANRNSQSWGEGGVARHRAGAKTQLERAMEFHRREGRWPSDYELTMIIHAPQGPGGTYTYPKIERILTKVQQETEQLSQQHASSAGENTDPEESSPTPEVDMSQLYINKAGKSKGRIMEAQLQQESTDALLTQREIQDAARAREESIHSEMLRQQTSMR